MELKGGTLTSWCPLHVTVLVQPACRWERMLREYGHRGTLLSPEGAGSPASSSGRKVSHGCGALHRTGLRGPVPVLDGIRKWMYAAHLGLVPPVS